MGNLGGFSLAKGALAMELTRVDGPDPRRMGRIVRVARKERGWTQQMLGERCRLSASTISRLESGKQPLRDIVLLRCLAKALELPVSALGLAS